MREITAKQEKLIALLLTERTVEAACEKAGVNVSTYWRWMKNPFFLDHYRRTRRGILENTVAKLQGITFGAIDTLERNLNCENPSVEVRSAAIILDQAVKGLEMLDLAARVDELEMAIKDTEAKR